MNDHFLMMAMLPRPDHSPRGCLPYASRSPDALLRDVDRFLALPAVQRALHDDAFRLTGFQQNQSDFQGTGDVPSQHPDARKRTLHDIAEELHRALNQTQKLLADTGRMGVSAMSRRMEQTGLLLKGSEFRSDYSFPEEERFDPPLRTPRSLLIHDLIAVQLRMFATTGGLSGKPDTLVTVANGLHLGVSSPSRSQEVQSKMRDGYVYHAKEGQSEQAYGYGNPNPETLRNRIQGAHFRHIKMWEEAEAERKRLIERGAFPPCDAVSHITLTTEFCTQKLLEGGARPLFFRNRWNIGPQAESEQQIIDFRRGNIRQQLQEALRLVDAAILDFNFPKPRFRVPE